jgi:hypothetical protein
MFTVEFDSPEELAAFRGETSVKNAGFADSLKSMGKSFYKATRNVVAPQYSKEYKQTPTLGKAHGGTHWLIAISAITGIYALKKAYQQARAEIVAELKEDQKTVSNAELRTAAARRVWQNIKNTKFTDQKLLIGSGAGILFAFAAKALCSFKPAWVGGSKAPAKFFADGATSNNRGTKTFKKESNTDRDTEILDLFGDDNGGDNGNEY